MRSIDVSRDIAAPRAAVWAVLADYPNIADWNSGIKTSFATSDETEGVGATRHCDLAPLGQLEETIAEWQPEELLVINIDSAKKLPIKRGIATFTLAGEGDSTTTSINYCYETKYGAVGNVMASTLDKQLLKGFDGFLADLDVAARKAAPAASGD